MTTVHFEKTPYQRDLFGVPEEEVKGKFSGYEKQAKYVVRFNVIIQINTTNVSPAEYAVAPNITFISSHQAIINIYETHSFTGSWEEFQTWISFQENSMEQNIMDLVSRLNTARHGAGLPSSWYINYGLDDRDITVYGE